ncbi:MAG: single-stranded DNA-binding protein [Candidatus Peribacteraceae bacterium]|nr:single-stranded DNA-binding protein [Candidatus Peribacteraceae bacterium]MDD5074368.1 single-stranded DNA-binding protein [Candidatus Peribacteraceae bacterium]
MFSLNRVNIIGYQTQPLEVRKTPGGTNVADLNLVVPYSFRSEQGEMLTGKAFQVVTLWGSMAEFAGQYVRPGSHIFIGGRLQTDSWDDQTSGEKRSKTKIVALDMILLDPKDGQIKAPDGAKLTLGAVNRADIVGNVTRDPEIRTTTGGKQVMTLGVATNDRWKERSTGEMKERAEFHNVVIWGELAEEAGKVIRKGSRVFVSGRVQTRSWETQAGQKRTTTEIIADQCSLLGVKSEIASEAVQMSAQRRSTSSVREEGAPVAAASPEMPEVQYTSEIKVEDLPF